MRSTIHIFLLLAMLGCAVGARGQGSPLLYGSQRIPQMNEVNPAFFPSSTRGYMSTFGLHVSYSLPFGISEVAYDTVMGNEQYPSRHYTYVNLNRLAEKLADNSQINVGFSSYLPCFGLRFGKNFLTFSSQIKTTVSAGFPFQALKLLTEGNAEMDGSVRPVEMVAGKLLDAQAYLELGVGYGREIIDGLTVGVRVKPVLGLINVNTGDTRLTLETAEGMDSISANVYYQVQAALPAQVTLTDSTMDELLNSINGATLMQGLGKALGWGLDLGAVYRMGPFEFSASITDLGRIKWKNVYELHPRNGESQSFAFTGVDVNEAIHGGSVNMDTLTAAWKEQLDELSDATVTTGESYSSGLHTKFNLGAFFNVSIPGPKLRVGLLFHGERMPRMAQNLKEYRRTILCSNTTLMADLNLFDWVELTLSNTIVGNGHRGRFFNPGLGINVMLGHSAQMYFLTDYVSHFNFAKQREASFYFGTNLLFGRKKSLLSAMAAMGDGYELVSYGSPLCGTAVAQCNEYNNFSQ